MRANPTDTPRPVHAPGILPSIRLALVLERVPAGFPSPAADYLDDEIDLTAQLVQNPASTFLIRVKGDSMKDDGIYEGDVLVVDRSLSIQPDDVVLAVLDGEFTVKRFRPQGTRALLIPSNPAFPTIEIDENRDFRVWGKVTYSLHKL